MFIRILETPYCWTYVKAVYGMLSQTRPQTAVSCEVSPFSGFTACFIIAFEIVDSFNFDH